MPKVVNPNVRSQAQKMYESGASVREIADRFGITDRTVKNWAIEWKQPDTPPVADLPRQPNPPGQNASPEEVQSALEIAGIVIEALKLQIVGGELKTSGIGAASNALLAWIRFREEKTPRTIGDVVNIIVGHLVAHNLSPRDFAKALKKHHDEHPHLPPDEARELLENP
jgi:transposase-like protein